MTEPTFKEKKIQIKYSNKKSSKFERNLLERLGDSRLAIRGTRILLPFEHSTRISSSNVQSESGTNLILNEALKPGAITDWPCGYCPRLRLKN